MLLCYKKLWNYWKVSNYLKKVQGMMTLLYFEKNVKYQEETYWGLKEKEQNL